MLSRATFSYHLFSFRHNTFWDVRQVLPTTWSLCRFGPFLHILLRQFLHVGSCLLHSCNSSCNIFHSPRTSGRSLLLCCTHRIPIQSLVLFQPNTHLLLPLDWECGYWTGCPTTSSSSPTTLLQHCPLRLPSGVHQHSKSKWIPLSGCLVLLCISSRVLDWGRFCRTEWPNRLGWALLSSPTRMPTSSFAWVDVCPNGPIWNLSFQILWSRSTCSDPLGNMLHAITFRWLNTKFPFSWDLLELSLLGSSGRLQSRGTSHPSEAVWKWGFQPSVVSFRCIPQSCPRILLLPLRGAILLWSSQWS